MALSREEIERRWQRVDDADTDDFATLVKVAALDPARHLRRADWSGVSFRGSDLRGFDFSAARLHDCDFTGAKIAGARFAQAELGAVLHHGRANPREPARMTGIAGLRAAADWAEYVAAFADPGRCKVPVDLHDPRHLPVGAIFSDAPCLAPEMVVVPAGTFLMGSPDGSGGDNGDEAEKGRTDDEGPRQLITFDRPFAIGRFAVTVAELRAFTAARAVRSVLGPAGVPRPSFGSFAGKGRERSAGRGESVAGRDGYPATDVTWEDAAAYCQWLNTRLGLPAGTYRLPSEAEWEYCARAGTDGPFWWDGPITTGKANYDGNYTYAGSPKGEYRRGTVPVDAFQPNPWGLYQVHGNVWEWCQDTYTDTLAGIPLDGSSRVVKKKSSRVLRGGCWDDYPLVLRSAYRDHVVPGRRIYWVGFRVARTLSPPAS